MLDTLRLSLNVPELSAGDLLRRGWDLVSRKTQKREDVWAHCAFEGVRLNFAAGLGWLTAEASLPSLVLGDNAELLDWAGCEAGMIMMRDRACEMTGAELAELADWRVTRFDPVWSWPVSPAPYIAALRLVRLPRTRARSYESSIDWLSRGRRIRARLYDKAVEAGHSVTLPCRLERQIRPRREVVRLAGERVSCSLGDLSASSVRGLLRDALADLGLDKPIPTLLAVRERLIDFHGRRRGVNLWRALLDGQAFGFWPAELGARNVARYLRLLRAAGVYGVSESGELPPLVL